MKTITTFMKLITILILLFYSSVKLCYSQYAFQQIDKEGNKSSSEVFIEEKDDYHFDDNYNRNYNNKQSYSKDDPEWFKWHTDEYSGSIGIDRNMPVKGPLYWTSGIGFSTEDLEDFDGKTINTFRIYFRGFTGDIIANGGVFKIWQGSSINDMEEVLVQSIDDEIDAAQSMLGFKSIELDEPYTIDASKELYAGVEWDDPGDGYHPACIDTLNPPVENKGGLIIMGTYPQRPWDNITSHTGLGQFGNWMKELITEDEDTLKWHVNELGTIIGARTAVWTSAIKFIPEDLEDLEDKQIGKFKIYTNAIPDVARLRIWEGHYPDNLILRRSQVITNDLTEDDWSEIPLNTPHFIDIEKDLVVGVEWTNPPGGNIFPASYDDGSIGAGTTINGKGNLVRQREWTTLYELDNSYQGNWMKEILVEPAAFDYNIIFDVMDENFQEITDALIELDGSQGTAGQYEFYDFNPGLYNYVASKQGYMTVRDFVFVDDGNVVEEVIMVRDNTSINNQKENKLLIYPNPVKNILNIENQEIIENIQLLDTSGRIMYKENVNYYSCKINVENFYSGIYLLIITTKENTFYKNIKILK